MMGGSEADVEGDAAVGDGVADGQPSSEMAAQPADDGRIGEGLNTGGAPLGVHLGHHTLPRLGQVEALWSVGGLVGELYGADSPQAKCAHAGVGAGDQVP